MKKNKKFKAENSKFRKVIEKRGFYIALFACVAIIGTSIFLKNISDRNTRLQSTFDDSAWQEAISESKIDAKAVESPLPETTEMPNLGEETSVNDIDTDTGTDIASGTQKTNTKAVEVVSPFNDEIPEMINPCIGGIIKDFSIEELLYSETMNDWRTHNGIDIAAELGTSVKAAAAGVVEKVYEDEALGVVVVIRHSQKLQTLYANLQSADFIKVGRQVQKGDIIGGVGQSALSEIAEEAHLHFEVLENGELVSPNNYLRS